jgi:succinyl-diaminopimelate desuccinylase
MKMAIACYILLLHELKDQLSEMNIGLMLTSDEEIGGMQGVKRLLEAGYSSKIAFLPDGGFNWNFEEAAKGVLQVKITARGVSSHSSRPWLGENAIDILMSALKDIHLYFDKEKLRYGTYFPTANVGIIQGGKGVNQVPDYAEAKIDIRYPPEVKGPEIYSALTKLLKKDPHLSIEIIAEGSPHRVDLQQPPFLKFQEIAKEMYGIEIGKVFSYGASDARFFGERNIPVLVIAPKGGEIHSDGEWIDLEDLTRFYNVLKQWVK